MCSLCRLGLAGYDDVYSYGLYTGILRQLIHQFKYQRVEPLAVPLAVLMARALPRERGFDCIVPLPLHWRKRWQRGFNQSELLARELSRRLGLPVLGALARRRPTRSQTGLSHAQRRENVRGAFRLRRPAGVLNKRILLVDDVLTTGATASACAAVLKRAGARQVTVLTLARTDRRSWLPPAPASGRQSSFFMGAS